MAQWEQTIDGFKRELVFAKADTQRLRLFITITEDYFGAGRVSCDLYGQKALKLATQLQDSKAEATALTDLAVMCRIYVEAPHSLAYVFEALEVSQSKGLTFHEARRLYTLATLYGDVMGDMNKAFNYLLQAKSLNTKTKNEQGTEFIIQLPIN